MLGKIFKKSVLTLFLVTSLSSCAAGNEMLKTVQTSVQSLTQSVYSGPSATPARPTNVLPPELQGILAPEKKTSGNYPRIALALEKIPKEMWGGASGVTSVGSRVNACVGLSAQVWTSPANFYVKKFDYCRPENGVYNVSFGEVDYFWSSYSKGDMAAKAPRRGGPRQGPETPRTFWPNAPEDVRFLGNDYDAYTEVTFNYVTLMMAGLIYYFDLDWHNISDQRLWISSIDRSGFSPRQDIPVYKTP